MKSVESASMASPLLAQTVAKNFYQPWITQMGTDYQSFVPLYHAPFVLTLKESVTLPPKKER